MFEKESCFLTLELNFLLNMWHTPSSDLGAHIWIKLIELVRQHPTIYLSTKKRSSKLRRNRNEINQIWENIAAEIGLSVGDCKRRWKGLKDVHSKIRKRRVQENVLGIKARKKWLYEDAMSFMKFPFEHMYHKALENLQADCDDRKIQDAESNDTEEEHFNNGSNNLESIDVETKEHLITGDQIKDDTKEYLDLYFEVDAVPKSDEYVSTQTAERNNCANDVSGVQASSLKENHGHSTETKAQLKYRAIRPKPYQSNLLCQSRNISGTTVVKNNLNCISPLVNLSSFKPLNQIIVSNPTLQGSENCNTIIPTSSNIKEKNYRSADSTYGGSISTVVPQNPQKSFKDKSSDSSVTLKKCSTSSHLPYRTSTSGSIESFFKSMAQTVMNLPTRAQAEIKMEICKLVTRAEIQYYHSQSPPKLQSCKFGSEKG